jgi:hypothetical protein
MGQVINALKIVLDCIASPDTAVSHVIIKEESDNTPLKNITISNLDSNMLVFLPDKGSIVVDTKNRKVRTCMSPLFSHVKITKNNNAHHNKACDAVIIQEQANGKCRVLYIDLKSGNSDGVSHQFKSTQCFSKYLREILKTFHNVEMIIEIERFIVLTARTMSIAKASSIPQKNRKPANDPSQPEVRLVKNKDTISVKILL